MPTADGGSCVTDAAREAVRIANAGFLTQGKPALRPKDGARFHFELPGSMQGFRVEDSAECRGTALLKNVDDHSTAGARSLAIAYQGLAEGRRVRASTATFIPPEARGMSGYDLMASPTIYPGQVLRARVSADARDAHPVDCCLYVAIYGAGDRWELLRSAPERLAPGEARELSWNLPATDSAPIAAAGVELAGRGGAAGTVYVDWLTWDGMPSLVLGRPSAGGTMWERAWMNGVTRFETRTEPFRIIQNAGRGLLMQGTREWTDYLVSAQVTPWLATAAGIAARVQGMRRYYALLLHRDGHARLLKFLAGETILSEIPFAWEQGRTHRFELEVRGNTIAASIDGKKLPRQRMTSTRSSEERPRFSARKGA